MKPLTGSEIEAIMSRCDDVAKFQRRHDLNLLVAEIDRVSDMLSDCWLLLDEFARAPGGDIDGIRTRCGELLKKQNVPWLKS